MAARNERATAPGRHGRAHVLVRVRSAGDLHVAAFTSCSFSVRESSPPDPLSVPERGNEVDASCPLSRRERGTGGEDSRGNEVDASWVRTHREGLIVAEGGDAVKARAPGGGGGGEGG